MRCIFFLVVNQFLADVFFEVLRSYEFGLDDDAFLLQQKIDARTTTGKGWDRIFSPHVVEESTEERVENVLNVILKRQDFLKEKLDMLTPVLMSKVMPGAAKTGALGEELVRQFLKSLSPKQMESIVGALSPEQAAVINEVYVAYGEAEVAKDEAKKTKRSTGAPKHE